jgi:hypothetical protein
MAKYGFDDFAVTIDLASGSTPTAITSYVTAINAVEIERIMEEITPAGAAWETWAAVGLGKMGAVELSGKYDDTATTGPDAIFCGGQDVIRTLLITWGSTKTTSCEVYVNKYVRSPKRGELTAWSATLQPTGTVTEA